MSTSARKYAVDLFPAERANSVRVFSKPRSSSNNPFQYDTNTRLNQRKVVVVIVPTSCSRCGAGMSIKLIRRGPRVGREFWGCDNYRTTGCRGSAEVPCHDWDWFGYVPVPVSIVRNQARQFQEAEASDPWLTHGWAPHDEIPLWERLSLEADHEALDLGQDIIRRREQAIRATLNSPDKAMGQRAVLAVSDQYFSWSVPDFASWLTSNFAGSFKSHGGGIIRMDDGSFLELVLQTTPTVTIRWPPRQYSRIFSKPSPVFSQMPEKDFATIGEYFARNFGLGVHSVAFP